MPVDDPPGYDVEPVEGNPFGAMASSPNDYDVAPVDHDPFQTASQPADSDPSAAPRGWWDTLFGGPERRARQPTSRGALLGAGYQGLPTSPNIEDRRRDPFDLRRAMVDAPTTLGSQVTAEEYPPSPIGGAPGATAVGGYDPMLYAADDPHMWTDGGDDTGPYEHSFNQNWRAPPSRDAPYRRFDTGPNLPRGQQGTSVDPEMPYMGGHLPISPGDPGWTSPPSLSGPHNRQGDPDRPGYGRPIFPLDAWGSYARGGRAWFAGGGPVRLNEHLRRRLELITQPRHGFQGGGGLMDEEERALQQREGIATADSSVQDVGMGLQTRSPGMFGGARPVQPSPQFGTSPDQTPPAPPEAIGSPTAPPEEPAPAPAPLRQNDPAFPEGRITTLRDTSHEFGEGTIGHDTLQASPAVYPKTAAIIKEMPYEGTKVPVEGKKPKTVWTPTQGLNVPADATPAEAHEHFIEFTKSNLLALHDAVPPEIREGSAQWYDGANKIATDRALQYGKPVENTAGVYAALSPQMDWYKNASLGDRVMDTMHNQQDTAFTPAMWKWARTYAKGDPDTLALYRSMAPTKDSPGRTLGSINDPDTKAHWIRAFDEAHNDRSYNLVNPDGSFGAPVQKADGTNAGAGWGTMDMISNAVQAFEAPDMPTVSRAMGNGHKVRNFYNDILNPNDPEHGDVTIDTHAIAGGLLRPLSGSDKDTTYGLGTAGPEATATGTKGLYGVYAEAYRRAAAERGLLPRQMQSITWEAVRGLFSAVQKRTPAFRAWVSDVWNRFKNGFINQQQAQRELIYDPETGASRIRPPSWHTGTAVEEEE